MNTLKKTAIYCLSTNDILKYINLEFDAIRAIRKVRVKGKKKNVMIKDVKCSRSNSKKKDELINKLQDAIEKHNKKANKRGA